jgi:hypothetical protein
MRRLASSVLLIVAVLAFARVASATDFFSPTLVAETGETLNCYFTSLSTTLTPVYVSAAIIGPDGNGLGGSTTCGSALVLGTQTTCSRQVAGPAEGHCSFSFSGVSSSKARGSIVTRDANGSPLAALEARD